MSLCTVFQRKKLITRVPYPPKSVTYFIPNFSRKTTGLGKTPDHVEHVFSFHFLLLEQGLSK